MDRIGRKCLSAVMILLFACSTLPGVAEKKKGMEKGELKPNRQLSMVARILVYGTEHSHFKMQKVNREISRSLFDDYFKLLDSGKNFFTQEDIASFASKRDTAAVQLASGDINLAFDIFNRFLFRIRQYESFVKETLEKPLNLSTGELYEINRSKLPWPADDAALRKLWKLRLTNDMILMNLTDRARNEEQKKETAKNKKNAVPVKKIPARERIIKRIRQYVQYYGSMEAQDVAELYFTAFMQVYDPHSSYMAPRTQEDFDINMKLSLVGIGAVLTNEDGYTKIVKIIPGGPAAKDGRLKAGDRIASVTQENGEQTDLLDMPVSKVVKYIRGKKGTRVTLSVIGQGGTVQKNITLVREEVKLKDSEASGTVHTVRLADGKVRKIGVISLPSFYIDFEAAFRGDSDFKSSTRDVLKLIGKFTKEGPLDGLVIDLRSNGGGSLMEAVSLTGLFIPQGPVVQVRDPKKCKVDEDTDGGMIAYGGPLIVLTNRLSASAAEIFAGAIQDYRRGIIVGDAKTHGKGTVQTVSDLGKYTVFLGMGRNTGSMKLTNAKFYRINGESTQLRGVRPDIVFPSFSDLMDLGEDKLDHAMPWDKIDPVSYVPLRFGIPQCLPVLKDMSAKRVQMQPEFRILQKDLEIYRRIREKKSVVLDLEKRWVEYQAEKKLLEEQEKLMKLEHDDADSDSRKNKTKDIFLDETLRIMGDYISWIGKR